MKKTKITTTVPTPIKVDGRTCFGIAYFTSEEEADRYSAHVQSRGETYNGGWLHGKPCGRDKTWDHTDETLGPLFAVTEA